jgi:aspartyl-tRNA(Asn)/glutamyl-tRNA(Gln) amidotransferase subunit B
MLETPSTQTTYEPVIGLEVHVQLKTASKMFTSAPYYFGAEPNTLLDPVVLALPGTLPVINKAAIWQTVKVGLLLGCDIASVCKWDRKNYFYPDSPKGYQISQYDQPLCLGGQVEIELPGAARNIQGEHRYVQLTRIHLEEDVGKLTHNEYTSFVDFNRAGTPLIEIVSEPDLYNSDEAFAFLNSLRMAMAYAGVSDCDMEKGQMRCDANISLRPKGSKILGTKVEIKNLNTISGVRNAIEFEIRRQTELLEAGEPIIQETRRWSIEQGATFSMRTKEKAHDYRYFPDPDLMPVRLEPKDVAALQKDLPELPFEKQRRFYLEYELPYTITSVLCPDKGLCDYFEAAVSFHKNPKGIANLIANDLLRELSLAVAEGALPLSKCKVTPQHLAGLVRVMDEGIISKQMGQDVFIEMFKTGQSAESIIDSKGLAQNSDLSALESFCQQAIDANPAPVAEYKAGKEKAINALKGKVMQLSQGKANPALVDDMLKKLLS